MSNLVTIASSAPAATKAGSDHELLSAWMRSKGGSYDAKALRVETVDGSPHTIRLYARIGEAFLSALPGPLRHATIEDVQAAVSKLRIKADGSPASAATVSTYLATVKSFLRFAHRVGYTNFNAGELLKVKAPKGGRAQRILPKIDAQLILRAGGSPRNRLLLNIAYYGALRVSELASLTWGSFIERENGLIQIAGLIGKGNKERQVLLPTSVAKLMKEAKGAAGPSEPVFVSREGTRLSERMINHIVKAAAERAGLPPSLVRKISPHWLRHAHASHALDNGAPISLVSQTLGHASISTTSIYAHARPGDSSALYLDEAGSGD